MNTNQILHLIIVILCSLGIFNWNWWIRKYKRGIWLVLPVFTYFANTLVFHAVALVGFPLSIQTQNIWSLIIRVHSVIILAFMPYILISGLNHAFIAKAGENH